MKLKWAVLCFVLLLAGCGSLSPARSQPFEEIETEVQAVFNDLVDAAKAGDIERYFSFFDRSTFTALMTDGSTIGTFDAFRERVGPQLELIDRYNSLKFDPVTISVLDSSHAVLVNEYSAEVVLKSGDVVAASGAGVQVWSKHSGTWTLVHVSDAI
ncbi:MAG: nuclear transport factor 2 family protein, partial [Pseudomonadota bacterium]